MKNKNIALIFIIFILASVAICVGLFVNNPTKQYQSSENTEETLIATVKPIDNVTEAPTEAPAENTTAPSESAAATASATAETTGSTTAAPTATPSGEVVFPEINNDDFAQYANSFDYFSTLYVTGENNQNVAKITEGVEEKLKNINYTFYKKSNTSDWDVYLTFTLNYEDGYTEKILDLLKEKGVKATFFVSYDYISQYGDIVKRMKNEGHTIGNRGPIGESKIENCTAEEYAAEIIKIEKEYQKLFGEEERMTLFRTDYFSERTLKVVEALGYTIVFRTYSVFSDASDIEKWSAEEFAVRLNERAAYNGSVAELTCDKEVLDALSIFIDNCKGENINIKSLG